VGSRLVGRRQRTKDALNAAERKKIEENPIKSIEPFTLTDKRGEKGTGAWEKGKERFCFHLPTQKN